MRDSVVLTFTDPALPCRATTVPSPSASLRAGSCGTGSGFTTELCDGRSIVLGVGKVHHLADDKILIWASLILRLRSRLGSNTAGRAPWCFVLFKLFMLFNSLSRRVSPLFQEAGQNLASLARRAAGDL